MQQRRRHSRIILGLLALGLLAGAALTAGPAQAASGPGYYYAEPAWDRQLPCPTPASCPRFLVLTDWASQAVLDKETGLVWEAQASPVLMGNWQIATTHCLQSSKGGRFGWRLPTVVELTSVMSPTSGGGDFPKLEPGNPFTLILITTYYWSATTVVADNNFAYVVHFGTGQVIFQPKALPDQRTWCVRGGMNAATF